MRIRRRPPLVLALAALIASLNGCDRGCDGPASVAESSCPPGAELATARDEWGHRREWCQVRQDGKPMPHGRWIARYPKGTKAAEGEMRRGAQVGDWTFWDEDGLVIQVSRFGDGNGAD